MKRIVEVVTDIAFDKVEGPPFDRVLHIPREGIHVYITWEDDDGNIGADHYVSFLKPNMEAGK